MSLSAGETPIVDLVTIVLPFLILGSFMASPVPSIIAFVCGLTAAYKYYCSYIQPKDNLTKVPFPDLMTKCCARKPKVLFFPDQKLPCNTFYQQLMRPSRQIQYRRCPRSDCQFFHLIDMHRSSLMQIFLALNSASCQIDICMYILTNKRLAEFLVHLKRTRGIRVRLITDCGKNGAEQNEYRIGDQALTLANADLEVRTNSEGSGALMHNKFVIIDSKKLITGSFNWTMNAVMRNDEAIMIMTDKDIIKSFSAKFENLWRNTIAHAHHNQGAKITRLRHIVSSILN